MGNDEQAHPQEAAVFEVHTQTDLDSFELMMALTVNLFWKL